MSPFSRVLLTKKKKKKEKEKEKEKRTEEVPA